MAPSSLAFAPSSRSLPWQEPLAAYRSLRAVGLQPLLLDGLGAHPEARWAYLALHPAIEVRATGEDVEERHESGLVEVFQEGLLAYLRRRTRPVLPAGRSGPPFVGGWIGFVGFGFANRLEPTLPAQHPATTPDLCLRLCRTVVAFDRHGGTATAFSLDLDGDVAAQEERLTEVEQAWVGGKPAPRSGSISAIPGIPVSAGVAHVQTGIVGIPGNPGSMPPVRRGVWETSLDEPAFTKQVLHWKELIHNGDLFQANLATRFASPCGADPADLFEALQRANPAPWMALLEFGDFSLVSASPEQLFAAEGGRIRSRPIAGTRKRGATPAEDAALEAELLADPKERAEHTMLVDLVRNDVARVSLPGTVGVPELMSVERYRHVMHLVSRVEGRLRPGTSFADWLAALFPGGTVTGAPKARATQRILEAEPMARGPYTGSAGFVDWSGDAHWNILIRTLLLLEGTACVHAGSGIVADSDPAREWKEANRKARALLDAAAGAPPGADPGRLGEVTPHGTWSPPAAAARHAGKRVLLVDNLDSFVHNLAERCEALGATVRVVRNDADWRGELARFAPTHVILSPGPGWPGGAGCTPDVARELHGRLPLLGVCLGHQAIGEAAGGRVVLHPGGPVHGQASPVLHGGGGLFVGLPSPLQAARYHSLAVEGPGPDWLVDARLADGTVMALRHREAPTFGLQFHPESLCTPLGLELLDRFLESSR